MAALISMLIIAATSHLSKARISDSEPARLFLQSPDDTPVEVIPPAAAGSLWTQAETVFPGPVCRSTAVLDYFNLEAILQLHRISPATTPSPEKTPEPAGFKY